MVINELVGLIILFFSMIIQVIIPPIPAELIVIAAGKQFGTLITTVVAGTGLWIGSIIVYILGKVVNKRYNRFFNRKKLKNIIKKLKTYENMILWIRILPYNPSDIISYAAGILKYNRLKFIKITFVTSYVRCFLLAYLGSNITSSKNIIIILLILSFSAIIAHYLLHKKNK